MGALSGPDDSSAGIPVSGSPGAVLGEVSGTSSRAGGRGSAADGGVDGCGVLHVGGVEGRLEGDSVEGTTAKSSRRVAGFAFTATRLLARVASMKVMTRFRGRGAGCGDRAGSSEAGWAEIDREVATGESTSPAAAGTAAAWSSSAVDGV